MTNAVSAGVGQSEVGSGLSGLNLRRAKSTVFQPSPELDMRKAEEGVTLSDS